MFCNQCGKDNRPGTRFCVQCGAPLQTADGKTSGYGRRGSCVGGITNGEGVIRGRGMVSNILKNGLSRRKKTSILICLFLILVLISGYHIVRVWISASDIDVANEYQMANIEDDLYETNSYIYFINRSGLYRVDKESKKTDKITNKSASIAAGSADSVYFSDANNVLYEISDGQSEPERILSLSSMADKLFFKGKYQYYLYTDGSITKQLNSEKFTASVMLYQSESDDDQVLKSAQYDGYLYMCIHNDSHDSYRFIRVSLSTGKEEILSEEDIRYFAFSEKNIVCLTDNGEVIRMDYDGGNTQEYTQIDAGDTNRLFCSGDYVYYVESGDLYRFNIDGGTSTELDVSYTGLSGMINCLAHVTSDGLDVYNYNGKLVSEIEV